jgi:hypothetical protein
MKPPPPENKQIKWVPINIEEFQKKLEAKSKYIQEKDRFGVDLDNIYLKEFQLIDKNKNNQLEEDEFNLGAIPIYNKTYPLIHQTIKNVEKGLFTTDFKRYTNGVFVPKTAGLKNIVIVVEAGIYNSVETNLNQYIRDIKDQYSGNILLCNNCTKEEIKSSLMQTPDIAGTIFVGTLPVAWTEYGDRVFVADRYFTDFNDNWNKLVGCHENIMCIQPPYSSSLAPEIFLGRIIPPLFAPEEKIRMINSYLVKNHKFRLGQTTLPNSALAYFDDDWQYDSPGGLEDIYTNIQIVRDPAVTNPTDYLDRIGSGYSYIKEIVHSGVWYHYFATPQGEQVVSYEDIKNKKPKFFFAELNNCSSGNFTFQDYLAGWYVFQNQDSDYGLVATALTAPGATAFLSTFYQKLANGKDFGSAFSSWLNHPEWSRRGTFMPITILGDPTLVPSPRETNTPPKITMVTTNPLSPKVGDLVSLVAQVTDTDPNEKLSGKLTITTTKGIVPLPFDPRSKGNGLWEFVNTYKPLVAGKYGLDIEISDSSGNKAATKSSFTVTSTNNPPVITTTSLPTCVAKKYYTAKVEGSDKDITDKIKMTVSGLPKGLTFGQCVIKDQKSKTELNSLECPITGIATTKGRYNIKISLTDTKDTVSKTLTLNCL